MPTVQKESHPDVGEVARPGSQQGASALFMMTLWFGLLAGWLELGLVLAQRAVNPHISIDALRTNQHFVWMIPVSHVLIFGVVGLSIALLARFRREFARWIALRLPVGMSIVALLLTIKGLYTAACVILACGLVLTIGPWLERRVAGFVRLVRVSFPVMALSLAVLTGLAYERVTRAEDRALSIRPPAKSGAPNVLLIVLDTVRAANLSLYGYLRPTTPNLERLARKGVVFSEARSTSPWTLPTHASMMTGRWPHKLSVGPDLPLDGTFPTLAEVLGREGFATAGFVGNTYYCNARYGLDRGFARYEDDYENQTVSLFETVRSSGLGRRVVQVLAYAIGSAVGETSVRKTAAMLNRDVLGWLSGRPAGRPFFAFINYYDAHRPYVLHGDPDPRFGMAALPYAEQAEIDKRFVDLAAKKPAPVELTPQRIANDQRIVNEGFTLYNDSYDSCIAYLDRHVGLLLDEMERLGSLENTLVIVTSDHGEQIGERGLIGHGTSVYRSEVHVPLLVIPPSRSSPAKVVHEPVSLREIPATVAEWVDLGARNPFPGRSLTRFLGDGTERLPETSPVLSELLDNVAFPEEVQIPPSAGSVRSLVSRDQVYIRREDGREELYDLLDDPLELFDLTKYSQSRPVIDRFREELSRIRRCAATPAR
jgi:arylsulfatase A-like enzyme